MKPTREPVSGAEEPVTDPTLANDGPDIRSQTAVCGADETVVPTAVDEPREHDGGRPTPLPFAGLAGFLGR